MSYTPNISEPSSSTSTPPSELQASNSSSYFSYPVSHVVSGLYRRITEPSVPPISPAKSSHNHHQHPNPEGFNAHHSVYIPPHRTASPFQPPPLTPLSLSGIHASTSSSAMILSRALAEEIRLLVPPRLQLQDTWSLTYSIEQDGTSLGTLYQKCSSPDLPGNSSFVLVIRDAAGGIFGAYLTTAPYPSPSFYGTGECFLWRASHLPTTSSSLLSSLPPPPSAPTTSSLPRSTTLSVQPTSLNCSSASSSQTELIRFKAFPYSGVNDYLIFCEPSFLSIGGGDGKYGLWLDRVLENGISAHCMTFGNEPLSEEGEKFEVLGVEVWCLGS